MKYTREQIEKAFDKVLSGVLNNVCKELIFDAFDALENQQPQKPTLNDHPHADNIRAWAEYLGWDGDIDEAMSVELCLEEWHDAVHENPNCVCWWDESGLAGELLDLLFSSQVTDLSISPPEPRTEDEQRIDEHYRMMGLESGPVYVDDESEYDLWSTDLRFDDTVKRHKWEVGKTKLEDLK